VSGLCVLQLCRGFILIVILIVIVIVIVTYQAKDNSLSKVNICSRVECGGSTPLFSVQPRLHTIREPRLATQSGAKSPHSIFSAFLNITPYLAIYRATHGSLTSRLDCALESTRPKRLLISALTVYLPLYTLYLVLFTSHLQSLTI